MVARIGFAAFASTASVITCAISGCQPKGEIVDYQPQSPVAAVLILPETAPVKVADALESTRFSRSIRATEPITFEGDVILAEEELPQPVYLEIFRAGDPSKAPIQTGTALLSEANDNRWRYRINVTAPYKLEKTNCEFRVIYGERFVGRGSLTIETDAPQ